MENIFINESKMQFKNPVPAGITRACEEHFIGRRIFADVDGKVKFVYVPKEDAPFECTISSLIEAVKTVLAREETNEE